MTTSQAPLAAPSTTAPPSDNFRVLCATVNFVVLTIAMLSWSWPVSDALLASCLYRGSTALTALAATYFHQAPFSLPLAPFAVLPLTPYVVFNPFFYFAGAAETINSFWRLVGQAQAGSGLWLWPFSFYRSMLSTEPLFSVSPRSRTQTGFRWIRSAWRFGLHHLG